MIEDRILKGMIKKFLDNFGIQEQDDSVAFEHFCNYCLFTHHRPDAYSTDNFFYRNVHTGKGGDKAIDGIMIEVNEVAVSSLEQLKDVVGQRKFHANFVFLQAKTSSKFDSGDMLKTGLGVKDFFQKERSELNANENILHFKEMADYILENSIQHDDQPTCTIYYVTTGKWVGDKDLENAKKECENFLNSLNYFGEVRYVPIDALKLSSIFKEVNNSVTKQILMSKSISFPSNIKGVEQAYIGLVSVKEYLKLIENEEGMIQQGLFYDNVRSYLGENPVNKEIIDTIKNENKCIQFPILNNGVTIVTKSLRPSGEKYTLSDFQIVNGCQTSNVLYKCRNEIKEEIMLPVKIVCTEDPELINDVIRSTNRQTQVLDEAFESLKVFHKHLQDYYETYVSNDHLYYERRTHEYDNGEKPVKKSDIITLPIQLMSMLSMFLEEPHSVHRYYGELLNAYRSRLFQSDHKLSAYYISAWALHRIEDSLKRGKLNMKYRKYRYHMLFLIQVCIRRLAQIKALPRPNSHDMEKLCNKIRIALSDNRQLDALLRLLTKIIDDVVAEMTETNCINPHEIVRRKEFTILLEKKCQKIDLDFKR